MVHDKFQVDTESLGLDRARSSVVLDDSGTLTAELRATTAPIAASGWALSPPILYFRSVPLVAAGGNRVLIVDDVVLDEYDVALYFMEHYDVEGTLVLGAAGTLTFDGTARLDQSGPAGLKVQWTPWS